MSRTLERLRQFLTLVGLTALLVGGVGIANAVATYIDRRRRVIAAFKSLGATGSTIFGVHLLQVLFFAAIGVVIGMALGLLIPVALTGYVRCVTPDQGRVQSHARAACLPPLAYGFMVALLFTLWPLGRAEQVRAGVLFRDEVAPERILPSWRIVAFTAGDRNRSGRACDFLVRGAVAGALLLPGRGRRLCGLPGPGHRG